MTQQGPRFFADSACNWLSAFSHFRVHALAFGFYYELYGGQFLSGFLLDLWYQYLLQVSLSETTALLVLVKDIQFVLGLPGVSLLVFVLVVLPKHRSIMFLNP